MLSVPDLLDGAVTGARLASHTGVAVGLLLVLALARAERVPGPGRRSAVPADGRGAAGVAAAAGRGSGMRRWLGGLLAVLAAAALNLLLAAPASAHTVLVGSDPADGSRLAQSPASVTLRFNEQVGLDLGYLRVVGLERAAGRQRPAGTSRRGGQLGEGEAAVRAGRRQLPGQLPGDLGRLASGGRQHPVRGGQRPAGRRWRRVRLGTGRPGGLDRTGNQPLAQLRRRGGGRRQLAGLLAVAGGSAAPGDPPAGLVAAGGRPGWVRSGSMLLQGPYAAGTGSARWSGRDCWTPPCMATPASCCRCGCCCWACWAWYSPCSAAPGRAEAR